MKGTDTLKASNKQASQTASPTVVTFASYSHRVFLLNWLVGVTGAGIAPSSIHVICVDKKIAAWLSALGKNCEQELVLDTLDSQTWITKQNRKCDPSYSLVVCETQNCCSSACAVDVHCNSLHFVEKTNSCRLCTSETSSASRIGVFMKKHKIQTLFKLRIKILREYISRGKSIILSDLDATWVRSPVDYIVSSGSDIVAQRGSYPKNLAEKWGATVCMGFLYIKSCHRTETFLEIVQTEVDAVGDDQIAFNKALDLDVISWGGPLTYETNIDFSTGLSQSGIAVTLLPHNLFPRICPWGSLPSMVVVAHCFDKGVSKSDPGQKMQRAASRGIWYLKSNWKDTPVVGFDDFLNEVANNSRASLLL